MSTEKASAKADGDVLPENTIKPAEPGFLARAEKAAMSIEERVVAAIDGWYERHFHACAVAGRAPLSADDKTALVKSAVDAVAPATKE